MIWPVDRHYERDSSASNSEIFEYSVCLLNFADLVNDAYYFGAVGIEDAAGDGARALIAGNGHIRRDRGVPLYLARHDQRPIRSVALQAVHADAEAPGDYHPERFDFIIFTPRVDDIDPCVRFKEQLEKMRKARQ